MNYRIAVEELCPTVEYHWAGDSGSGGTYADIQEWDRNGTGVPLPSEQELLDYWAQRVEPVQPPAPEERLAALEDAMLELILGG